MKLTRLCLILAASLLAGAAHASASAFANNPTGNSTDWANQITSLGGVIDTSINFETHPLGVLQPGFYAGHGVNMVLSGSGFSFNAVYDYRNNYDGTVSGYGPNSPGEGVAAESRAFSAFNPNGSWSLTLNFDQAVLGAGLFVIDLFNGQGDRTVTLSAYDGINGTGNLLTTAIAPSYNYQLYNKLFLGVANDSATPSIRSVVFTNPFPKYGDGIALDDFRVAAGPEPETWAMLLIGLGLVSLKLRRTASHAIHL